MSFLSFLSIKDSDIMVNTDEVEINVDDIDRDNLIKVTANAISKVQHKAINGRFKDDKKENIRIQYWKTLNGLIKTLSSLINDKEIDRLQYEIQQLKLSSEIDMNNTNVDSLTDNLDAITEIDERLRELQKIKD